MILWFILSATPPPDFFGNSVWQFFSGIGAIIAIPIAVIATVTAILAYRQQQHHKEIAYQIISNASVVSVNELMRNRVEILLDGNPIKDARLLVMEVWNSGNASIHAEDYFEPLKFKLEDGAIISTDILQTNPEDLFDEQTLKTFLKSGEDYVELHPFPLNPQNSIRFSILLSGTGKLYHRGRLDQGKIINYRLYLLKQRSHTRRVFIIITPTVILLMSASVLLRLYSSFAVIFQILFTLISFLLVMYLYFLLFRNEYLARKTRERFKNLK